MEENKNNNKFYSYDEVYEATLKYFNGDDLATTVWIKKYCHKFLHDDGTVDYYELTPEDMFHRLAKEYARAGEKYNNPLTEEEIFELFDHTSIFSHKEDHLLVLVLMMLCLSLIAS